MRENRKMSIDEFRVEWSMSGYKDTGLRWMTLGLSIPFPADGLANVKTWERKLASIDKMRKEIEEEVQRFESDVKAVIAGLEKGEDEPKKD